MIEPMTHEPTDQYYPDAREARWRAQQVQQPAPRQRVRRTFWEEAFALDGGKSDMHPEAVRARTRIAWRLTRFLAVVQGRIASPDAPLTDLSPDDPSMDEFDRVSNLPRTMTKEAVSYAPKIVAHLAEQAIPLVPPRPQLHLSHDENTALEQEYLHFHEAIKKLKKYIGNPVGPKDPFVDSSTWYGILDKYRCFQLYPEISEILLYEERLINKVLHMQVERGQVYAHKYLRYTLFLSENEARSVIALARKSARQQMEMDQEDERAMMTLRLQNFQQRAQAALNLREELQALKQEAVVRGLTKTQPETFMDVFARVVSESSRTPTQPPRLVPHEESHEEDE